MGRLFWKLFFAFLAALTVSGLLVAFMLSILLPRPGDGQHGSRPRPVYMTDTAEALLRSVGEPAVRAALEYWQAHGERGPWVIAPDGRELLGRTPEADTRERLVRIDGADWRIVEIERRWRQPPGLLVRPRGPPGPRPAWLPPPPFLEILTGVIGALAFSAALAWYLSRPVRHLHRAFDALAHGDLDARVVPLIGTRRDEIADLGRGFDRMAGRIQQLLDAQRRLLHDVSHELRSPLARMSAAVGLARQDPARREAMLDRVEAETARLDALVGELLGLSRLEDGAHRVSEQPVDLAELLQDIAEDARFEATSRGVHVEVVGESSLFVQGDASLLHRAFDNVLRNAVKFSPAGSGTRVELAHEGNQARIAVIDAGCGVPDDELERIFEPFFRGARARDELGTGLGLSIARRAIEAHSGTIHASLPASGGLRIDISLPLPH